MRKFFVFLFFICSLENWVHAQGITFEQGSLREVLAKAKKAGKPVFIDCYTTWCGPCQVMSSTVFTDTDVGSYFNKNFLNLKLDMEKGDGPAVLKKYQVEGFPTYLFLDGDGSLLHRSLGRMDPETFIVTAREVFNDQNVLRQALVFKQQIQDSIFVKSYLKHLEEARMDDELRKSANEYLEVIPPEWYVTPFHWSLIRKYVLNYQSPVIRYVLENLPLFYVACGKTQVEECLRSVYCWQYWNSPSPEKLDIKKLESLIDEVRVVTMDFVPTLIARLNILRYSALQDLPGLAKTLNDCFTYNLFNGDLDQQDGRGFVLTELHVYCRNLVEGGRTEYNSDIVRWFKNLMTINKDSEYQANCMAVLYHIIEESSDRELLTKIAAEKEELRRE